MSMDEFDTATIWLRRPMPAPVVEGLVRLMRRFPAEMFFLQNRTMVEGRDTRSLEVLLGSDMGALLVVEAVGPGASGAINAIRQFFETFETSGKLEPHHGLDEEEDRR